MELGLLLLLGLLLASQKGRAMEPTKPRPSAEPGPAPELVELVKGIARAKGVPPHIACAFVELESGWNPTRTGDRDWGSRQNGRLYRAFVLENERLRFNPARLDPDAWKSYGLFQLLAPYHVKPDEHPRALLDPVVNTERGVSFLRSLLQRTNGDVTAARLLYVGCGADGSRCSAEHVAKVKARLQAALQKWGGGHG